MNQRTIEFHMIESGELNTAVPQYAGVKGEHNATEVAFVLSAGYSADVNAVRLSFNGGDGTIVSTDLLTPLVEGNHARIAYLLPKTITALGGQLEVRLVLAHVDENGDETVVFCSHAAVLYFDDAVLENGTPFWTGVSQMLKNTVDSVSAAREARNDAESAREDVAELLGKAEKASESAVAAADSAVDAAAAIDNSNKIATENATKAFGYARNAQMASIAAEEARDEAKMIADSLNTGGAAGLTAAQITALDGMFKIAAYTADANAAYTAFKEAFGLIEGGGDNEGGNESGGEVHTHKYTSTVTTAATCTTEGVRTFTCACGDSYTEKIAKTAHTYANGACTKCGAADPNYNGGESGGDTGEEQTAPVYALPNATTFDGTNAIDTGYKLLDTEKAWTVCADFIDTARGGVVWDASPNASQGLALAHRGGYFRQLYLAGSLYKEIGKDIGNYKVIVTHAKNADGIKWYVVVGGATLESGEITYTKYLTDSNILHPQPQTVKIGGDYAGTASYKGTVHRLDIYERVLTESEINAFMGVSE